MRPYVYFLRCSPGCSDASNAVRVGRSSGPSTCRLSSASVPAYGVHSVFCSFIPEDTQVSLVAYTVHRNPANFSPLPNFFWPDRWLAQDSYVLPTGDIVDASEVRTRREAFMAFSQGQMVCAGRNVAQAEMRAAICAVLREFDLHAEGKAVETWEDGLQECFVTKVGELKVGLAPRR